MDITNKIDILLQDEISSGAVATNTAKGKIDVVGGKCPDGQVYDKIKKVCVPSKNESGSVSAMVAGSGQTRVWGSNVDTEMPDLNRKEPVEKEYDDPTATNILGRKGLKFNKKSGAFEPSLWSEDE